MKIDNDLRLAINAAARTAKNRQLSWSARRDLTVKAIDAFLGGPGKKVLPKVQKFFQKQVALAKREEELKKEEAELLHAVGIHASWSDVGEMYIRDEDAFTAAGGQVPNTNSWFRAEDVIARLIAAPESEKTAILAEYGIIWE